MKILITGAAGFIGFHLCKHLLENSDHTIVGVDNLNDYYPIKLKLDRLKELGITNVDGNFSTSSKYPNLSFAKLDISDRDDMECMFQHNNINIVCNLAAQAGVRYSLENPHTYLVNNVIGFGNILEYSQKYDVQHVIYASSSSVYGMNSKIPFSTEDVVDHPVSLYAATKKSNELMAHVYSHLYNVRTTGLRFFTVYGPWGRPDMAPMLFTKAILSGKEIKVFNQGDMLRDFTYVGDVVDGIYKVISTHKSDQDSYYSLYNIGKGNPIRLLSFIETLEHALGKTAIKKYMPMQPGDVKTTYADTSALRKRYDYLPSTTLEKGINKFVQWYIEYYK